ncbi:RNA polymerase sigma factor [Paraburkholderia acidisoli]|uniref:Sigma-70 family RNA polymerase sigma factor n=1 Tax=Paraburkholderia acidisoli TaxID=2571748 RepID=A0A7Z2GPG6_9BURK|nr:sigma-70 family RNA polymerase sigma factor [Paraburkholderia acidisoli]QGZ65535.1 sigma-70 family RNA polymerase sigma factor [Paraburkholderia acidisoli]
MEPPHTPTTLTGQDREIADAVARERPRLRNFIRRRVIDQDEAEDILQDVFEELVGAWRLTDPIEQVGAWLFRVARNRIVDRFRKKKEVPLHEPAESATPDESDEAYRLDLALPSPDAGPEAAYARAALLDTLRAALDELPANQRDVFVAHELDGRSFKEMAAETGVSVNTLLARKRYAVLHLRERLRSSYDGLEP